MVRSLSRFTILVGLWVRLSKELELFAYDDVGWMVVLGFTALWDSISVYIGPSPREREKEEKMIDKRKKCPNNPHPRPTASTVDPCPTIIKISRTPRHWKFTQHYRTTRPPLSYDEIAYLFIYLSIYLFIYSNMYDLFIQFIFVLWLALWGWKAEVITHLYSSLSGNIHVIKSYHLVTDGTFPIDVNARQWTSESLHDNQLILPICPRRLARSRQEFHNLARPYLNSTNELTQLKGIKPIK